MVEVMCTVVLVLANGYREPVQAKGIIVNDDHDFWQVDFSQEIKKRKLNPEFNQGVQIINGNDCLYLCVKDGIPCAYVK